MAVTWPCNFPDRATSFGEIRVTLDAYRFGVLDDDEALLPNEFPFKRVIYRVPAFQSNQREKASRWKFYFAFQDRVAKVRRNANASYWEFRYYRRDGHWSVWLRNAASGLR